MSSNADSNIRPDYDQIIQIIQDIADYVSFSKTSNDQALKTEAERQFQFPKSTALM